MAPKVNDYNAGHECAKRIAHLEPTLGTQHEVNIRAFSDARIMKRSGKTVYLELWAKTDNSSTNPVDVFVVRESVEE